MSGDSSLILSLKSLLGRTRHLTVVLFLCLISNAVFGQADTIPSRDNNMAMGNPSGAVTATTDSNNYLLVKSQYVLSYNNSKGMANWVSWHLSSAWKGSAARCNCFTTDATLPAGYFMASTSNYTGTGFDRGHLCPSDDRDGSDTDNAATFKMSNISPQAPVLNEQTWGDLENYCRSLLNQGKEMYIIAGGYGSGGSGSMSGTTTSIASGGINVPAYFWKIVVVLDVDTNDVARVNTSTRVITVLMPNNQTVNSHPWDYYRVSVDSIQTLTGYNFLSNVDTTIQEVIEARVDNGPSSLIAWDFTGANSVTAWAATSVDNNLDTSGSIENITRGSGAAPSSAANSFRTTGFRNDGISTANTDYYQVKMRPKAGYTLSLTSIDATFAGTGTYCASPGVSQQFAYSTDGSTFILIGTPYVTIGSPGTMNTIDISGISALQNIPSSQTIYFRYFASGQTSTGGWGFYSSDTGLNGLSINGNLTPSSVITGPASVCVGATTTLSDASTGGTWNSGATGIATVGPSTGVVTGVASGTATISYTVSGSTVTTIVTVNPPATVGAVSGPSAVCVGSNITLTDAVSGGVWSAGATGATIVGSTGMVTGVTAGTDVISYTVTGGSGCANTAVTIVTVIPTPASINGATSLCTGTSITLTDNISGGTWSSTNPATESVDPLTGTVNGLAAGTNIISYSTGCGTPATYTVTAVPPVAPISGATTVCQGSTTQLTDAVPGGTWTSLNPSIGTVDGTGMVTATGSGSLGLSYYDGCGAPLTVTVNAVPITLAITRANSMCAGGLDTLADAAPGGTWSGSVPGMGTINPVSGILTAGTGSAGTITISYSTGCGDTATYVVTVNPLPNAGTIAGPGTVCAGSSINLTDITGIGTWSSSIPSVASIGSSSGVLNGITTGTSVISYTVANFCGTARATTVVTVTSVSAGTISGPAIVNVGSNITLSDPIVGGTWTASNSNATVSGGLVTGSNAGTVTISYSVSTSCGTASATKVVTVNASSVAPIMGTANVCIGATTALTDATAGGAWSSSNTLVATVATSGVVTGAAAGTARISYTISGVSSTIIVTVNAGPSGIGGASAVCVGSSVSVSDFTGGGTWSSTAFASVVGTGSATGLVTGVSAGTAIITYALSSGCYRTYSINVNAVPAPISGATTVCAAGTSFFSDATSGSVSWTSSNTSVATISYSGTMLAMATGTTTITYLITDGCIATVVVTVNTPPSAIAGNTPVCQSGTIGLSDGITGGAWTSGNPAKAIVGSATGIVTGVSGGTAVITYSTGGPGCSVVTIVTVNPLPNAGTISGASTVCTGSSVTLSDIATGGVWSSGATGVATVTATGVVTGVSPGSATIRYTVTNSCATQVATLTMTVIPATTVTPITGVTTVCTGATTNLSDATPSGNWSSSAATVATISTAGTVTGVATGTTMVSYSIPGSCGAAIATTIVTVTGVSAGTISGVSAVYDGSAITLSDVVSGGVWTASNSNVTVSSGLVTGVNAGTVTISYSVTNGCGTATATHMVTVNPSVVAPITGVADVCIGLTTALTDVTPGGTWHSSNVLVATVSASGVVTGVVAGTAMVSYTVSGVPATVVVTINAIPSGIGGASSVCVGSSISVSDFTGGGTWSSTARASVVSTGTASALVTGLSSGTATITYSLGSGCYKTFLITVSADPAPIAGTLTVCAGGNKTFLSDAVTPAVTWTSGTTSVATVSASGAVTGINPGTTIITYTISGGCRVTAIVTVNPLPVVAAISGASTVSHAGPPITLSDVTIGGVWSSTAPAVATIGSSTGVVTAVASSGNTTISYTVSLSGCTAAATKVLTASSAPHSHAGNPVAIIAGTTVSLTDNFAGGVWGTSDSTVATVDSDGLVFGVAAGFTDIMHTASDANGEWNTTITRVTVTALTGDIRMLPNPNNGTFTIAGKRSATAGDEIAVQITTMTGREVYKQVIIARGGLINEQVKLSSALANGLYLLNVKAGKENNVLHFVIEK